MTETNQPNSLPYAEAGTRSAKRPRRAWRWLAVAALVLAAFALGILSSDRILSPFKHKHDVAVAGGANQLWTCGMHPQVIQNKPGDCPICHMALTPLKAATTGRASGGERQVKYWWDPMMNPPYISQQPGKSPMGMDLVPVYEDEVAAGPAVQIDPVVVQNMGVRVQTVTKGSLQQAVRVVGYLEEPSPLHRDINLRVSGWIEKLYANIDGMQVKEGDPLFDLYSPEVQVAVQELITARRSSDGSGDDLARKTSQTLYEATREKLLLWGLQPAQVEALAKSERAPGTVAFLSPMTGHVTEKSVYEGAAVQAGQRVLQLANRSDMWIDAQVYERQLPAIKPGLKATASIAGLPERPFEAEVQFIHPHVDPTTRTALVRLLVSNEDYALRQGMYATVDIVTEPLADAVVVPREAVIDTGTRQIAFIAAGGGHFEPRRVKVGFSGRDGMVQVLEGLAPGEQVVTSGQFLLDSESRLKEAIEKHLNRGLAANTPATEPSGREHATQHIAQVAAPTTAPTTRETVAMPVQQAVDRVATAYLNVSAALGASQPQKDAPPLKLNGLASAAEEVARLTGNDDSDAHTLAQAVDAMAGKPLSEQRDLFAAVSDTAIRLLEKTPPSHAVADKLFVARCPMALNNRGASWLQRTDTIANPYFAASMKRCGEVTRELATRGS